MARWARVVCVCVRGCSEKKSLGAGGGVAGGRGCSGVHAGGGANKRGRKRCVASASTRRQTRGRTPAERADAQWTACGRAADESRQNDFIEISGRPKMRQNCGRTMEEPRQNHGRTLHNFLTEILTECYQKRPLDDVIYAGKGRRRDRGGRHGRCGQAWTASRMWLEHGCRPAGRDYF